MILSLSKHFLKLKFNIRTRNYVRNYSNKKGYGKLSTSYCHELGISQLININFGDVVDRAADNFGDTVTIVIPYQNIRKTCEQFKKDVDQLAISLIGLGLQKNDRIAMWSANNYEWAITQFAATKAGLIMVCLNPAYKAPELEFTLNKVQCKALITDEKFKTQNLYEIVSKVVPEILNCKPGQICSQKVKSLQHVITLSNQRLAGTHNFKEILKNDGSENVKIFNERRKKIQCDDPSTIIYTSGTTGNPKGATLSHFQLINQALGIGRRLGFDKEPPIICLQVPYFHAFGYILGPLVTLLYGGNCVFPSEYFNAASSLKAIQDEKCTLLYGVPTMYFDMLQHLSDSNYDLSSLKRFVIGAAPVADHLVEQLEKRFQAEGVNGYGTTETSAVVSVARDSTMKGSGRPVDHAEIKIVDNDGSIVPINTKGEILCRSPFLFLGYWEEKEKTAEVLDNARWYHTGDIGSMDEDGNVYVTGRIKELIIRGGENIYPQEIENLIISHPAVSEAYAVGVPDIRMGEEVCCCIHLKPNQKLTEKDVKEFCNGKISQFKIPKYVLFLEEFPKTESGKIQKFKLEKQCATVLKL